MPKPIKIEYTSFFFDKIAEFSTQNLVVASEASGKVVLMDQDSGSRVIVSGEKLKCQGDMIVGGEIESWSYSVDGSKLVTVTGAHLDAKALSHTSFTDFFNEASLEVLESNNLIVNRSIADSSNSGLGGNDVIYAGNGDNDVGGGTGRDRIYGQGGDDTLHGDAGNDRLTGGPGSDLFVFANGEGKDVVTDFDAIGGEGNQDFIGASFAEITVRRSGSDTVIDFGGGDTLTLLDVRARDIDASDFKDVSI